MGNRRRSFGRRAVLCATAVALCAVPAIALARLPNAVIGTGVEQHSGFQKVVLVNRARHTVYMWTGDGRGRSKCYGTCLDGWKPVLTGGKVFAKSGSGVHQRLLGTTRRSNGKLQVTYNHHPLYTYTLDTRPGDDFGQFCQGSNGVGHWFVLGTNGRPIKSFTVICSGY